MAVDGVLLRDKGEVYECPSDDTGTPVGKEFEIPGFRETWIQLDAHVEVVDGGGCDFHIVGVGRGEMGFGVGKSGKEETADIRRDNEGTPVVGYDCRIYNSCNGKGDEERGGEEPRRETICMTWSCYSIVRVGEE